MQFGVKVEFKRKRSCEPPVSICATEAVRVGAEAVRTEQEAFLLREVTEGREGERVVLIDGPGHLARVERRRDLVLNLVQEGLGQEEVLAPLRIERAEEPELVFDDRTADVECRRRFPRSRSEPHP